MRKSVLIATFVVIILIIFIISTMLLQKNHYDPTLNRTKRMADKYYKNDRINALVNGSSIGNIPHLNLKTTNDYIAKANSCANSFVQIGEFGTKKDCILTCASTKAEVLNVKKGEEYINDRTILTPGAYCYIRENPLEHCNTANGRYLITINSSVCQSKHPRIIGGKNATQIVACNNSQINDPHNILWDYARNELVDPWLPILDTDERLPNGQYRYRCKFNGEDENGNKYVEHPFDRFHPIKNFCTSWLSRAHPSVKMIFSDDLKSYTCDCGDPQETRVRNLILDDKSTPCTGTPYEIINGKNGRNTAKIPYECVTLFSPIADVGFKPICPTDKFLTNSVKTHNVSIVFSEKENSIIEHPLFEDFNENTKAIPIALNTEIGL